jgi:hypothetical protein
MSTLVYRVGVGWYFNKQLLLLRNQSVNRNRGRLFCLLQLLWCRHALFPAS